MTWKEKAYKNYSSQHLKRKEASFESIKKQFPVWEKYFGKFLPSDKNVHILDAGAGNGEFIYWLNSKGFKDVLGIDISDEQVLEAKKLQQNVIKGDLLNLDPKMEYDIIFARDLIEHFSKSELLDLLGNFYSILKPGGILIIQTPNAESLFEGRYRYGDFTHLNSFTRISLNHALEIVGFKNNSFFPTGPVVHGLKSFFRKSLWKLFEIFFRFYLLIEIGDSSGIFTLNLIGVGNKPKNV